MKSFSKVIATSGFSKEVRVRLQPIAQAIDAGELDVAERDIARLALDACDWVEQKKLSPLEAGDPFTLLDIALDESGICSKLSEKIQTIIFEGMLIHDYGKSYGPDIVAMRRLASEVLDIDVARGPLE